MLFGQKPFYKENSKEKEKLKEKEKEEQRAAASIYSRAADDASPNILLKNLRTQIDPTDKSSTAIDPVALSLDNLQAILYDFSNVFRDMNQSHNNKEFRAAQKISVLWLYFIFSNYVYHWGAENKKMTAKLQKIQEFERIHLKLIGRMLNSIEQSCEALSNNDNMSIHQRLLMIQGYLLEFIKRQSVDAKEVLTHIPVALPSHQLVSSQSVVSQRKPSSASDIESRANKTLFKFMNKGSIPDAFKPRKQNENDQYENIQFIDATTGLELDFPLRGQITIETDGKQYHLGAFGRHDMVHTFKATILRQNNWVRIAFNPTSEISDDYNNLTMLKRISDLLAIPFVHDFYIKYQILLDLREKIRNELYIVQNEVLFPKREQEAKHSEYLEKLFILEIKIGEFINQRHLECLLREPVSMAILGFNKENGLKFKKEFISKNSVIVELQELEKAAYQILQDANSSYNDLFQQVKKANASCEKLQSELESLKESLQNERNRRARHFAIYKKLKQQKTQQSKKKLYETIGFLKNLDNKSIPSKLYRIDELKKEIEQAHLELTKMQDTLAFPLRQQQEAKSNYDQAKANLVKAQTELAVFAKPVLPLQRLTELIDQLNKDYSALQKQRSLDNHLMAGLYVQSSSTHVFFSGSSSSHQNSSFSKIEEAIYQSPSFTNSSTRDISVLLDNSSEFYPAILEQSSQEFDFKENRQGLLIFGAPVESTHPTPPRGREVLKQEGGYSTDLHQPEFKMKDTKSNLKSPKY